MGRAHDAEGIRVRTTAKHIALFFIALAALLVCGVAFLVNWIIEGVADGLLRASKFIAGKDDGSRS